MTEPEGSGSSDGVGKSAKGGGFFAIDARIWAKVTTAGMNEAVAYLVLACGTGHDNKSTSWSTNAVMKYAGIGWVRAKDAIVHLVGSGFIQCAETHTEARPRYQLATLLELVEHECVTNPPAKPDYFDQELLSGFLVGKQPSNKTGRARADKLCQRGLLRRDAQGVYRLRETAKEDSSDCSIWLPNTIVTGTSSGEESPVQRLRSAGCVWTLRLFVDLDSAQNLRDDGGVSPSVIRETFERRHVGQQGAYTLWAFKAVNWRYWSTGPFADHSSRTKSKPEDEFPIWASIRLLKTMGLLSFVPHIFENDTDAAEPIHVYGVGGHSEAPVEREIGSAASQAASLMCLPTKLEKAMEDGFQYFCPVLRTKPSAQMIGVARLTYRPRTKRTAAWFEELHQSAPTWIRIFTDLAAKGETATYRRMTNYA